MCYATTLLILVEIVGSNSFGQCCANEFAPTVGLFIHCHFSANEFAPTVGIYTSPFSVIAYDDMELQ